MQNTVLGTALATGLLISATTSANAALSMHDAIALAEQEFGGEAFEAERYRKGNRFVYEIEVLSGNRIFEGEFNATNGKLVDWDSYRNKRRIERVSAALERADLSLMEAVEIAETTLPESSIVEAELRVTRNDKRNGKRYLIETRSDGDLYEVVINSRNGRVLRIDRD